MENSEQPILRARRLTYGFAPGEPFLGPLDMDLTRGALHGVVGPNGAGKSTLLRLLVGLLSPADGEIKLGDRALRATPAGERARRIAFLPQHPVAPPSATAGEIVRLGRHPYRRFGLFESAEDLEVVRQSMTLTETLSFSTRRMETLSGGEAQRVHLAAALAQQPELLALDEPTSDLDLYHQLRIFRLLREWTRTRNLAVVAVTHDLNLAAQYCDQITVLHAGRLVGQGPPEVVLVADNLEPVYGVRFATAQTEELPTPWLMARDLADVEPGRTA